MRSAWPQFSSFMQYLGDYYPVTAGWAEQRTAWWNMLQQIFTGTSVDEAVATYTTTSNDALAAAACLSFSQSLTAPARHTAAR